MRAPLRPSPPRFAGILLLLALVPTSLRAARADEPHHLAGPDHPVTAPAPHVPEPVDSWVYDELEWQWSLGRLTELPLGSRPLARSQIAAAVARALAEGHTSVGLERLAREFAWEARQMGLDVGHSDTPPLFTLGPRGSLLKANAVARAAGVFENGEAPAVGSLSWLGLRPQYWSESDFGGFIEFRITEVPDSERLGDPVISGTDITYLVPRFALTWHTRWVELWAGRDNVRWGPGRSGGLLAGGGSGPYTQAGYRLHVGSLLTFTALHGWLSQAEGRYVAFHRLDFRPVPNLRLGIAEGARYDGTGIEPLYLINLVTYAAAERMLTQDGTEGANRDSLFRSNFNIGVDVAWTVTPGTTLYGEFMLDDWKTDGSGPTRLAYQAGARWVREGARRLSLQAELTRVYNYTYTVFYGRDFLHSGGFLGYGRGPDTGDLRLWADLDLNLDWSLGLEAFWARTGEGNRAGAWCPETFETENPYGTRCQDHGEGAPGGSAFAGVVEHRSGALARAAFAPGDLLRIEVEAGVARVRNLDHVSGKSATRPLGRVLVDFRW